MADLISAISVLIAALTFLGGVSAWKREFIGKRRIELAESILALFYEAEDAIREIRNPSLSVGEGSTRQRAVGEREEESQILDKAHVVFERYQKREKLFAQLRSMRYRCMAAFGSSVAEPFNELSTILNEIFVAAHMLGTHYWPRQGRVAMDDAQFEKHLEQMQKHEAVFWFMGEEQDQISPRVRSAVEKMEEITRKAVSSQSSLFQDWWNWVVTRVKRS